MTAATESLQFSMLPPAWARLRVDGHLDDAFARVIDDALETAPRERRPHLRMLLRQTAGDALAGAHEHGALELIMSMGTIDGLPIPATIAVFPLPVPGGDTRSADEILVSMAGHGARVVELDGIAAVRRVIDLEREGDRPSQRAVHYMLRHPHTQRWLLFTASVLTIDEPGYDSILEALEALVDAIMSTIRFQDGGPR